MSKRLSSDRSPNPLPGFEFTLSPSRPGDVDLSDERRFTGEVLFRDHPDVFKAVAAAFFIDGLSVRGTAARYRVSVNTVRAIRDMALESASSDAGRAAFFIKSKADRLHGIIRNRALEVIYDRLSDPSQSKDISVDTLMKLAEIEQKDSHTAVTSKDEIIDVDEFDDILNGLDGEKKSPREDGADSDVGDVGSDAGRDDSDVGDVDSDRSVGGSGADLDEPGCSTESTSTDVRSFGLSGYDQCLQGVRDDLCNSLCNPSVSERSTVDAVRSVGGWSVAGDQPGGSCVDAPAAAAAAEMDPGGGGCPGAASRGGSD